ncbi:hypothetical protein SANTM175S_01045 [Streptomyces antimycoticus]
MTIAPMKPAPASLSYSSPWAAIQPPTMPGTSAGRSAMA